MSEHTPGPLRAIKALKPDNAGGFDWAVVDQDENIVAEAFEHVGKDPKTGRFTMRPARANAFLYAAAPDLLEALKAAKAWIEAECPPPTTHPGFCGPESGCDADCMTAAAYGRLMGQVSSAIAKAKGGAS